MLTKTLGTFAVPANFPGTEYDLVNERVAARTRTPDGSATAPAHASAWGGFASAWNALAFRQRAAHEHAAAFTASIAVSDSPPILERAAQDHDLFGFFSSAASTVETFHFAMNCVGAVVWPIEFPVTDDKKLRVFPHTVRERFEKKTPGESLPKAMLAAENNSDLVFIDDMRRVLFHRGSPPRQALVSNVPGADKPATIPANMKDAAQAWNYSFQLVPNCLVRYERALDDTIRELVIAAADFVTRHL